MSVVWHGVICGYLLSINIYISCHRKHFQAPNTVWLPRPARKAYSAPADLLTEFRMLTPSALAPQCIGSRVACRGQAPRSFSLESPLLFWPILLLIILHSSQRSIIWAFVCISNFRNTHMRCKNNVNEYTNVFSFWEASTSNPQTRGSCTWLEAQPQTRIIGSRYHARKARARGDFSSPQTLFSGAATGRHGQYYSVSSMTSMLWHS